MYIYSSTRAFGDRSRHLNHGQVTRTPPDLALPPNFRNTPTGGRLWLDRFNMHRSPLHSGARLGTERVTGGSMRSRSSSSIAMDIFEQHQGTHILQSLDGFAFALGADGRFLYISETVSIYLGLSQVEMTGSSVFDYIHQQDHAELAEQLGINLAQTQAAAASPGSVASDDGSSSSAPGPTTPDRPQLIQYTIEDRKKAEEEDRKRAEEDRKRMQIEEESKKEAENRLREKELELELARLNVRVNSDNERIGEGSNTLDALVKIKSRRSLKNT
ncbi:protein trachealess [Trichonephila clavipes]|uniref:Protein trachealess n=1 Tax=Trichonephila clavipes TaxID=2585209 RepID=A0A8X6R891_TRICX|nr:protein trachealess [Trichonephila clavipes]